MTKPDFQTMKERLLADERRRRVALAAPDDAHTWAVVDECLNDLLADFTLFAVDGHCGEALEREAQWASRAACVVCNSTEEAARKAVETVRQGRADILMKGTLNTDVLLRAVLDKQNGLLAAGSTLSHITAATLPNYDRMLLFADAAVIPRPDTEQFDAIVRYALEAFRRMNGCDARARVALIHCTEKTNEKFPHTLSYAELKRRAADGRYGATDIDGPMDVKTACDSQSAHIKGIDSNVAGRADILIFPNIEAANTFYKTITLFAQADTAGMLCGATAPVVMASRADSTKAKMHSLLMACTMA